METLLGSAFFMVPILMLEHPRFAGNDASRMTLVMFLTLAGGATAAAFALAPDTASLLAPWADPGWLGLTLVLAVICTLFCFSAMNRWQPRIASTEAALIYSLEPVSVAVLALFLPAILSALTGADYPNEAATWQLVVGGTLITAANLMVALRKPRPPPVSAT
jgi:drug/metabolite transporter (DMT)-like permease